MRVLRPASGGRASVLRNRFAFAAARGRAGGSGALRPRCVQLGREGGGGIDLVTGCEINSWARLARARRDVIVCALLTRQEMREARRELELKVKVRVSE